jgi:hypothetical protein
LVLAAMPERRAKAIVPSPSFVDRGGRRMKTLVMIGEGRARPRCRLRRHARHGEPLVIKGLGEIAVVGLSAAIANAVYHATGRRIRSLPITVEQLL